MSEATMTIRLDEELKSKFFDASKSSDRNSSQVIRELMRSYVVRHEARKDPSYSERNYLKLIRDGLSSRQIEECISLEEHRSALDECDAALKAMLTR